MARQPTSGSVSVDTGDYTFGTGWDSDSGDWSIGASKDSTEDEAAAEEAETKRISPTIIAAAAAVAILAIAWVATK